MLKHTCMNTMIQQLFNVYLGATEIPAGIHVKDGEN